MQIQNIRKGFEPLECKFEPFEQHSNTNSNHLKRILIIVMPIRTIRKEFKAFECKFKTFERDLNRWNAISNHSNSIPIQILTIQKGF